MPIPDALRALTSIRDFIRWGSSEFSRNELCFGHGFASGFDEARYLVLHALSLPPDWPDDYLDTTLTPDERESVIELLRLRVSSRQPAAYITRESWFCGFRFYVDERVLVPRSPLAELIAEGFAPWIDPDRVERILDLCTGSGCIAIACQYRFPDAEVVGSDLSRDALEVARINVERHGLDQRLRLLESDLFERIPPARFDVIVSNPPYVDAAEMAALADEFRYEPVQGLAAGADGLELVDRILADAGARLADHGILLLEVGNSRPALEAKYPFLPMTWIDFDFAAGVCCIDARDLRGQREAILARAG